MFLKKLTFRLEVDPRYIRADIITQPISKETVKNQRKSILALTFKSSIIVLCLHNKR